MARKALAAACVMAASAQGAEPPGLFDAVADYCGAPRDILYAMSLVESGRTVEGRRTPWPWTINIEGKGVYFEDRETMFRAVMAAITTGQTIDIGLMQTNWRWSFDRLSSPWMATEPAYNLKTGCQILTHWYDQHGDWWVAVGKYHRASNAPRHEKAAKRYAARVYKEWERLQ